MRKIGLIVIHCSATKPSMDIGADTIRKWHTDPKPDGRGWSDIGYHHVIRRDGSVEPGRPIERAGAHVKGHNSHSIGVCMVGGVDDSNKPESNFTDAQWKSLSTLIGQLEGEYPTASIKGHHDLYAGKACPSFDVGAWLEKR